MCLAVVIRPEGELSKSEMETAFHQNPHGAGFAYISPLTGEIVVYKTMSSNFRKLWRALNRARGEAPLSQFLLHFRFATHGAKNEQNCHPFLTESKRMAVIHNGVLSNWDAWGSKGESDTAAFVRKGLSPLEDVLGHPEVLEFLGQSTIGSKVAMLTKDNRVLFLHEGAGHWINDVWYSNLHHAYAAAAGAPSGYYNRRDRWRHNGKWLQQNKSNQPLLVDIYSQNNDGVVSKITPQNSMFGQPGREMGSVPPVIFDYCPPRLMGGQPSKELALFTDVDVDGDGDYGQLDMRLKEMECDLSVLEADKIFGEMPDDSDVPEIGAACWYCGEQTISTVRLAGSLACEDCQLEFALCVEGRAGGMCGL